MSEGISHEPVAPGTTEEAEGKTNQPEAIPSDAEQVLTLRQTSNSDLAVDPNIEQPSQDPTEVVMSDPGAEDEE